MMKGLFKMEPNQFNEEFSILNQNETSFNPTWLPKIFLPEQAELEEMNVERDLTYMKRMYPEIAKEISKLAEDECDQLEFEGSLMFDEYPDKVAITSIVNRTYDKLPYKDEMMETQNQDEDRDDRHNRPPRRNPIFDLIHVILCNEMHCRRNRHRRRRSRFY